MPGEWNGVETRVLQDRPVDHGDACARTPRLKGTNDHYTFKQVRLQLKFLQE